jgi:hypothetical protein
MEQTRSSKFARVVGAAYIAVIIAIVFIYAVVGGYCDISGKTDRCESGGALMYLMIFAAFMALPLCATTYAVLFVMERL